MKNATLLLLLFSTWSFSQVQGPEIDKYNKELDSLAQRKEEIISELEGLKLSWIRNEMEQIGTPKGESNQEVIKHSALFLSYNEEHEQANWVMHTILPDIITGNVSRTNDFRPDSLVKTGSTIEKDYFLKTLKADGESYDYDGFGYDRGHLAPSADFRWSQKALSESYFYSNMSPQIGDFNREGWAELEGWMRAYVTENETHLFVVTAPVLEDGLNKVERSVNKVSIPNYFIKAAIDVKNNRAVGFILPHKKIDLPLEAYAVSIDSVEQVLGYDLFSGLDDEVEDELEAVADYKPWMPDNAKGDVVAIAKKRLPKKARNTYGIEVFVKDGKKHTVCGTVVSTKKHSKGHVFINLDKQFPNQIFSVTIFGPNIKNFDYEPEVYLKDKEVCFSGEIGEFNDTPSMVLDHGKQVKLLVEY